MSFNCMNINNSFLKMLDFEKSPELMGELSGFSKNGVLFKDKLASVLKTGQLQNTETDKGSPIFDKFVSFVSKELHGLKGTEFLKKLKEFFMMLSGNDLTKLNIDAQGLDFMKELLFDAGFEPEQLNGLIEDLKSLLNNENNKISMDQLMSEFSKLEIDKDAKEDMENFEDAVVIPISAFAFIESILTSIGIPEDVRNNIFSGSKTDQGIDLSILIKNLKDFEKSSFAKGEFFKAGNKNDNLSAMLNQLQIGGKSNVLADGKLSLEDFINILEIKKQEKMGKISAKALKGEKTISGNLAKNLNSQQGMVSPVEVSDKTGKDFNLIDKLLNTINRQEIDNDKDINIPLNKLTRKDVAKLIPFQNIDGNGGKAQTISKSDLEDTFTKLFAKMESSMDGKSESENKEGFLKGRHQSNASKISEISQPQAGEGKLLNSVRYLATAKSGGEKSLPSYVTNQVGRSIVRAFNQGQSEIKIQLKPPELGRIMISIEDMSNGIKVSVVAEHQTAKDMLVSNANSLKAALADNGISLENFDVDMGSNFNKSMSDTNRQSGNNNKRGRKVQSIDDKNIDIDNISLAREQHLTHNGVLYYVA